MTTTGDQLAGLMVTALLGKTGAANQVFLPRDWPDDLGVMPILRLTTPTERKQSLGRSGAQQFTVVATVRVLGRLTAPAQNGDAGAAAVLTALGVLQRQIEVAVINSYDLTLLIQQIAFVEATNRVTSEAKQHVGELVMDFGLEFYQGPEDFAQPTLSALEEMAVFTDLINVYDPNGTYPTPPFPNAVQPAPRAAGPDGRVEGGGLLVSLPQ
jgi:hypothetical protein